ncbi:ABC transporter substrate-binding protein [Streptomyces hesseae]|uniref:Extracellular solute-binding protein n=1 Tax=Streptomyces hesseae TaxID=3075519 RepID=A0ABU2SRI5_9ACTN|nr:extracellular solute-binding protein [Streptomyces sp. DSM 40473]MDT0450420.1 extracellular solute-binding protein [Streptomyces sp. DSM 40473]
MTAWSNGPYRRRILLFVVAAVLVLGVSLLDGCARDGEDGDARSARRTTITIGTFGVFGYKQAGLYVEYERLHPGVTIKETVIDRNEAYYPQLLTHLAAGSGLADIQAMEVANVHELATARGDLFEDLSRAKGVHRGDWLSWKWAQATTPDGRTIGLGTDIGPIAVCYRKDLFRSAGLPTDREAVGRLWAGDWRRYLEAGRAYRRRAPAGTVFTDSAAGLYNAAVHGYPERYYDRGGRPRYRNGPAVRASWDLATRAARDGLTARLKQFEKPWDQAYANGRFATVACPPWMLGYIKEKSGPAGRGQWDVAAAPRPANWGGSFIGVPRAARHRTAAIDLAVWLTAPAQQAKLFERQAGIPSTPASYAMPEVRDARNPYFGDAPIGRIFTEAARHVPTLFFGPREQQIGLAFTEVGIPQVEQQGRSPRDGWRAAQREIDNAVDE